jgi:hypothetical protein
MHNEKLGISPYWACLTDLPALRGTWHALQKSEVLMKRCLAAARESLMNILLAISATALLATTTLSYFPVFAPTSTPAVMASCAPMNGLNFVCGAQNPEDLVPIPGTRWLIASGMKNGAGLKLVDTVSVAHEVGRFS